MTTWRFRIGDVSAMRASLLHAPALAAQRGERMHER
jgi:hypothetical protein